MKVFDAPTMLAFVEGQRNHIETEVNRTIFPEIVYPDLVPVDNSAPEWTKTITFRDAESFGTADWINGNANDIPTAGNVYGQSQSEVHMAGVGYTFGYEEVQASLAYGVNLQNADAIAARETYERFVDKVALTGDASKNMQGLINTSGVTIDSSAKTFLLSTEDEILAAINKLISGPAADTEYQMAADTLLLPYSVFTYLASTPLSSKEGGTLLSFIQKYNTYTAITGQPLTIRAVGKLKGGGAGGSIDRAVAYSNNARVLKLHIPMMHKFLPVHQVGALNFVVPGIFRLGGLEVRTKGAMRYMDGV